MFHIKTILYSEANADVQKIYDDILITLKVHNIPTFFQIIANFDDYLAYIWPQIKSNLHDPVFQSLTFDIEKSIETSLQEVYIPDPAVLQYVEKNIDSFNKNLIKGNIEEVIHLNTQLILIFISLRESVKGWAVGVKKIEDISVTDRYEAEIRTAQKYERVTEDFMSDYGLVLNEQSLEQSHGEIIQSFYPKFIALLLSEIDDLIKDKNYLYKRVALEEFVLSKLSLIPHPIDSSYSKVSQFAYKYKHFDELLYILSETFPTQIVTRLTTSMLGRIILK